MGEVALSYRKLVGVALMVLSALVVGVSYLNYRIDAYDFYGAPVVEGFNQIKVNGGWLRKTKIEMLREQPAAPVWFLGSSRAASLRVPGRFINFAVSSAVPKTYETFVDFAQTLGKSPQVAFLGIDLFAYMSNHQNKYSFPPLDGSWPGWQWDKLILLPSFWRLQTALEYWQKSRRRELPPIRVLPDGRWDHSYHEDLLQNRPAEWSRQFDVGLGVKLAPRGVVLRGEELDTLEAVVKKLRRAGVTVHIYIPPTYFLYPENFEPMALVLKQELVRRLGSVYDFSGFNHVTLEKENFYDLSHFQTPIGDAMVKILLGQDSEVSFGQRLDAQNIDSYLTEYRNKMQPLWRKYKRTF